MLDARRDRERRLDDFAALCRRQGLALTVQRRTILEALLGRHDHPTADHIYADVRTRIPGVSRTTVYRVLETLVRLGVARKTSHGGAQVRFDPNTDRHHHLVCLQCGKVVDVEDDGLSDLPLPDVKRSGFTIDDYSIQFNGSCGDCASNARAARSRKRRN